MAAFPQKQANAGFCIYIDTVCEGRIPVQRDEKGYPVVYATEREAQTDVVEDMITRLEQFLAGERDFEDAVSLEEYIVPVDVLPDGSIVDEWDNASGKTIIER